MSEPAGQLTGVRSAQTAGRLKESAAGQSPEGSQAAEQPAGWLVTDPDGNVVQAGPQTVTEASAGAGQEQ